METYIVIPQYLVNDELKKLSDNALKSFRDSSDVKIICVNDGADSYNLKKLSDVYLENKENQGFAKTCNKGFEWIFKNVKCDCNIVCANNDIEVSKGWLEAMAEPFEMFENVAITGLVSSKERLIDGVPINDYRRDKMNEGGQLDDWIQSGGLWMTKKSILKKIGTFDEQFERGGYEDVDIFLRARDTFKMKIIMSARSMFWHKEGATRWCIDEGGFNQESKGYEERNREKFKIKWGFDYMSVPVWQSKEIFNG